MSTRFTRGKQHTFSIELKSRDYLKRIAFQNDVDDAMLIEGFLGELVKVDVVEGVMLEILGVNGTLRIDLNKEELNTLLKIVTC